MKLDIVVGRGIVGLVRNVKEVYKIMKIQEKYAKYFIPLLLLAIGLPGTIENLQILKDWTTSLGKWPWLVYMLSGPGIVLLVYFLIKDIVSSLKVKPEKVPVDIPNQDSENYQFLREKLTPEQLLKLERERSKQAMELEKDKRDKNMSYFLFIVFAVLIIILVRSCS